MGRPTRDGRPERGREALCKGGEYPASRADTRGGGQTDWERMIRPPRNPPRPAKQAIISMRLGYGFVVTMDSFERLLWWLFAGSAGARTRALVLFDLRDRPKNAQQLSQSLHLDYTTVRHHL